MQDLDLLNDHLIVVVCFISYKKWVQKTKTYKYNVPLRPTYLRGTSTIYTSGEFGSTQNITQHTALVLCGPSK